ncbi:MAG: hypothetical protein ACYSW3_30580 [Planctomycetota bacterium]|jgi:hypothetical protein
MKRFLLTLIMTLCFAATSVAAPFVVCDPQAGVESYEFNFPTLGYITIVNAETDGSVKWDVSTFPGGKGWHDGEIKACDSYSLTDDVTGTTTSVQECSSVSTFKLKVPNRNKSTGHKIQP